MKPVTNPELLQKLSAAPVSDPELLAKLNGTQPTQSRAERMADIKYSGPFGEFNRRTDALMGGILDAATFGFKDEILAGLSSIPSGFKNFDRNLQDLQTMEKQATSDLTGKALYGTGLLATGIRGAANPLGVKLENTIRNGLLPNAKGFKKGLANLGTRMGIGGAAAYPLGFLYGAGSAESGSGIEGRVEQGQGTANLSAALGAAGPAISKVGGLLKQPVDEVLNPVISEGRKRIIGLAEKYKIPIGIDDVSDSQFYKTVISEGESLPGSGSAELIEKQQKAFNRAVAKTIGQDADEITPEVIDKAYKSIGKEFDSLTSGKTFKVPDTFVKQTEDLVEQAELGVYGPDGIVAVRNHLAKIFSYVDDSGQISGENLAKARASLNKIQRKKGGNLEAKLLANDVENAVIDVITEGSAKGKKAFTEAKRKYKNFKTIQGLAIKDQVDGDISPALLTNAVRRTYGENALSRGKAGELGDLVQVGQLIKQKVPNSGTAQRAAVRNVLSGGLDNYAAVGAGFINPAIPALYLGSKGLALGGNRALQSRNYNPKTLQKLLLEGPTKRNAGVLSVINQKALQ